MNLMREAIEQSARSEVLVNNGRGERTYCFNNDFPGFSGHFPGHPVLPAVLQTLAAQMVVERMFGRQLRLKRLQQAKFTRQIHPDEVLEVAVEWQQQEDGFRCKATLTVAAERAAQFTLFLEDESAS